VLSCGSVDVKALKTYQQLFIYIVPIITNLGFINIIPVFVRLRWFKKHLKSRVAIHASSPSPPMEKKGDNVDIEDIAGTQESGDAPPAVQLANLTATQTE
jgi:hypothetical protein